MMMKNKLLGFFSGRNGFDELGRVLLWASLIGMLLGLLFGVSALVFLALIVLCYGCIRAFSRKADKYQAQNQQFIAWKRRCAQRFRERKTHKYFRCPKCRQYLRVPRGKGKISITCRSCGEKFIKKT